MPDRALSPAGHPATRPSGRRCSTTGSCASCYSPKSLPSALHNLNKTSLAHYEIVGLLGTGGMGEVYRARDTKLNRDVALKVLPEDFAADAERLARFEREAQAIAGLSHPHIVTLHSVDEADGVHFLTMELIDGKSLDQLMKGDVVPTERVLEIGASIADALAAAHQRGIVHRDLKPANVMIGEDGRAKVLDFGLAKLDPQEAPTRIQSDDDSQTERAPAEPLTTAGTVMGTPQYMSPEQVRGDTVDHRSDLFALGTLLYEMASGRRAFDGPNAAEITSSVLRDTPTPLLELRPDLPRGLVELVDGCLAKDRDRRATSAREIAEQLTALHDELRFASSAAGAPTRVLDTDVHSQPTRTSGSSKRGLIAAAVAAVVLVAIGTWWIGRDSAPNAAGSAADALAQRTAVGAEAINEKSIAVLPFANLSGDPDQEFFSAGVSEELLNTLARVPDLLVTARTSTLASVEQGGSVAEIAARLGVAHVLEGSVRRAGDRVRITAQLIHAADGFQKWSQTWDRAFEDIFAIQDEIARDTLEQLESTLVGEAAPVERSTDPDAYVLFLQARQVARERTGEALLESNQMLARVLEIDPSYVPAHLMRTANFLDSTERPYNESLRLARTELEQARAKAPDDAAVEAYLAQLDLIEGAAPLSQVASRMRSALARAPADPAVIVPANRLLSALGRHDQIPAVREWLVQRDPLNTSSLARLALAYHWTDRAEDCVRTAESAIRLGQTSIVYYYLALCQLQQGASEEALASVQQEPVEAYRMIGLPSVLHALGRTVEAEAALEQLIETDEEEAAYNIAYVLAFMSQPDRAFEWLDKAIEYQDPGLNEILVEPLFENLHDDPRWIPFLRRIGRAPEQIGHIEFTVDLPGR